MLFLLTTIRHVLCRFRLFEVLVGLGSCQKDVIDEPLPYELCRNLLFATAHLFLRHLVGAGSSAKLVHELSVASLLATRSDLVHDFRS